MDDPLASLSKGFSFLATYATKGAKLAVEGAEFVGQSLTENVIKPTTAAVRDPELSKNMGGFMSNLGQKVTQVGNKGLQLANEVGNRGISLATELVGQPKTTGYTNLNPGQPQSPMGMPEARINTEEAATEAGGWEDFDVSPTQQTYDHDAEQDDGPAPLEPAPSIPLMKSNDDWEDF